MFVTKNGSKERVSLIKLHLRLQNLSSDLNVKPEEVSKVVCSRLTDEITTYELDIFAADTAANLITTHSDYGILAARISISNLHKNTPSSFKECINTLYNSKSTCPLISKELYDLVNEHDKQIQEKIDYNLDFHFDYFGFMTLQKIYLLKIR